MRRAAIFFKLVGLTLCLAAPAVAAPAPRADERFSAEFSVEGSGGYLLSVDARPSSVNILVTEGHPRSGHFSLAEYTVRGTASAEGVEADFGSFGAISVHFEPSGVVRTKTLPKAGTGCRAPRKIVRRMGTFVGTIHFTGEAGYTTVETVEAKGSIGTPEATICIGSGPEKSGGSRHQKPPRHRRSTTYLGVTRADNHLGFAASSPGPGRPAGFLADSREKDGKVSILRFVVRRAPASSFEFDPNLNGASVAPPPPFSGTATFQRGRKGAPPSWSGSLAVSFLGAPDVPLTGSSFTFATLQRF